MLTSVCAEAELSCCIKCAGSSFLPTHLRPPLSSALHAGHASLLVLSLSLPLCVLLWTLFHAFMLPSFLPSFLLASCPETSPYLCPSIYTCATPFRKHVDTSQAPNVTQSGLSRGERHHLQSCESPEQCSTPGKSSVSLANLMFSASALRLLRSAQMSQSNRALRRLHIK